MTSYTSRKKSEQNGFAEEFARDIEFTEGRQDVKVKLEIDVTTELAAADLIKSGMLDHLLEGTGLTKEKLKHLDIEKLKPAEDVGEVKVKINPVIKNIDERSSVERTLAKNRGLKGGDDKKNLGNLAAGQSLPKKQDENFLPKREERFFTERKSEELLLPRSSLPSSRPPSDSHLPPTSRVQPGSHWPASSRYPPDARSPLDSHLPPDRYSRSYEDEYYRGRILDRRYDDPYYDRRGWRPPLDDPYYRYGRYPDYPQRPIEDVKIKPVVVMDYGHSRSKSPVEELRTGLTEEERSFMKRKSEGPKTDEELFREFLMWKKSKTGATESASIHEASSQVTSENYEIQPGSAPVSYMAHQSMDFPSYTTPNTEIQDITPASQMVTPRTEVMATSIAAQIMAPGMEVQALNPVAEMPQPTSELPPQVQELMTTLSKSMIHTEDEAAMALQVSNALTQALLEYQLKNISKELQDTVQQQKQKTSGNQTSGKAEPKKLKKQRFDAYSMIDGKTAAVTSSVVTSAKSSVSNAAVITKSQKTVANVGRNLQKSAPPLQVTKSSHNTISSQNEMSAHSLMSYGRNLYPATQDIMTSSYQTQPLDSSAQGMMMSSQSMMTSLPVSGYQVHPGVQYSFAGNAGYTMSTYQQFPMNYTPGMGQGYDGNAIQPNMEWNQMYMAPPPTIAPPPPLPQEPYIVPQPPLPPGPPADYPIPPPPPPE